MRMKRQFSGIGFETRMHSLHSECKNEPKSMLSNVNRQRNALPCFQMFAFSFFWRQVHWQILANFASLRRPPRWHLSLQFLHYMLLFRYSYLQILDSASESRFCVGNSCGAFYAQMVAPIFGIPALLGNPYFKMTEFLRPKCCWCRRHAIRFGM